MLRSGEVDRIARRQYLYIAYAAVFAIVALVTRSTLLWLVMILMAEITISLSFLLRTSKGGIQSQTSAGRRGCMAATASSILILAMWLVARFGNVGFLSGTSISSVIYTAGFLLVWILAIALVYLYVIRDLFSEDKGAIRDHTRSAADRLPEPSTRMRRKTTLARAWDRLTSFFSINETAVAVWAGCTFYIMYQTGGQAPMMLFPPLVLGAVGFILLTYKKPVIAKVPPLLSLGVFLLNFSILGSYLFNADRYELVFIVGNIVSSLLVFLSLYTIAMKMDLDFRKTLIIQCIFSTPLFPAILKGGVMTWGRLVPANLEPNYVGMSALLCFMGAIGVRSLIGAVALSVSSRLHDAGGPIAGLADVLSDFHWHHRWLLLATASGEKAENGFPVCIPRCARRVHCLGACSAFQFSPPSATKSTASS